jgi:hypothetical protein
MSKLPKSGEKSRQARRRSERKAASYAYRIDKRKVGFAIFLLLAFVGFGTWSLVIVDGPAGDRVVGAVLMALCLGMAAMLARDLKHDGPVVEISSEGILDRRKRDGLIRWEDIAGAEIRRASIVRGIRITLEDGKRIDLDTQMLEIDRKKLMAVIGEEARKAEARRN